MEEKQCFHRKGKEDGWKIGREGRKEGRERRKEGRKEGSDGGRKEGRNERRKEGRKKRRKDGRKEERKDGRKITLFPLQFFLSFSHPHFPTSLSLSYNIFQFH